MRIPCPFCGERDSEEFYVLGEVATPRPDPSGADAAARFFAYVYLRENRAGPMQEHWFHASGCRQWLVVDRDTRNHEILGAALTRP